MSSAADDVRSVAEQLRSQGKDTPARYADQAAEKAQQVGQRLQSASGDELLRDVEDFARRNPWAIAAGGLVLGLAASRMLKASSTERYRASMSNGSGSTAGTGVSAGNGATEHTPLARARDGRFDDLDRTAVMTAYPDNSLRDHSTGELLKELSDQTTTLVKQEIELAKAELAQKGKTAGIGAGMFGGAGLFGVGAFAALTTFFIALLDGAVPIWLAALIVAVVYAAVAGVLALTGKNKVKGATPVAPEQAMDSVKEDVQWAKTRARSGMR